MLSAVEVTTILNITRRLDQKKQQQNYFEQKMKVFFVQLNEWPAVVVSFYYQEINVSCVFDCNYLLSAMKDVPQHQLPIDLPVLLLFDTKIMLELNQYLFLFHIQKIDLQNVVQ